MTDTDGAKRPDLTLRVYGIARPQGSMNAFLNKKTGKIIMTHGDLLLPWRDMVRDAVREALPDAWEAIDGPVAVKLRFFIARPQKHYLSGRRLRADAPVYTHQGSDLDKLARAVCDALYMGGALVDDRVISILRAEKRYGEADEQGVELEVWRL